MRKAVLMIICLILTSTLLAQTHKKLGEEEFKNFEKNFLLKTKEIKTLQGNFVQKKTSSILSQSSISNGVMIYKNPSMLIWQYNSPMQTSLIVNGKSAKLFDSNGNSISNDRIFKQLGQMIINMINGNSITNNKQFVSEIYEDNDKIVITLTPVQKQLKEYYNKIHITINPNTLVASEIVMEEKSGDNTIIIFSGLQQNKDIPDSKFNLNR